MLPLLLFFCHLSVRFHHRSRPNLSSRAMATFHSRQARSYRSRQNSIRPCYSSPIYHVWVQLVRSRDRLWHSQVRLLCNQARSLDKCQVNKDSWPRRQVQAVRVAQTVLLVRRGNQSFGKCHMKCPVSLEIEEVLWIRCHLQVVSRPITAA